MPAEIASKRSTGSSIVVASDASIEEMRLPPAPLWSSVRTDIGTIATRSWSSFSPCVSV